MARAKPFNKFMVAPVSDNSSAGDSKEVSPSKRSLLHDLADRSAGDLTSEEKNCLLVEIADVFAENSNYMGRTGVVKHSIETDTSHLV